MTAILTCKKCGVKSDMVESTCGLCVKCCTNTYPSPHTHTSTPQEEKEL